MGLFKRKPKIFDTNARKLKSVALEKIKYEMNNPAIKKSYERKLILHNGEEVIQHTKIEHNSAKIYIIENGQIKGEANLKLIPVEKINLNFLGKKGVILELDNVAIFDVPDRNRGLGVQMITEAMHIAKKEFGQKELYLRSLLNKIEFYEKLGFKKIQDKNGNDLKIGHLPIMKIKL